MPEDLCTDNWMQASIKCHVRKKILPGKVCLETVSGSEGFVSSIEISCLSNMTTQIGLLQLMFPWTLLELEAVSFGMVME